MTATITVSECNHLSGGSPTQTVDVDQQILEKLGRAQLEATLSCFVESMWTEGAGVPDGRWNRCFVTKITSVTLGEDNKLVMCLTRECGDEEDYEENDVVIVGNVDGDVESVRVN